MLRSKSLAFTLHRSEKFNLPFLEASLTHIATLVTGVQHSDGTTQPYADEILEPR